MAFQRNAFQQGAFQPQAVLWRMVMRFVQTDPGGPLGRFFLRFKP